MSDLLPIHEIIPELKQALTAQNTAILQAPPGAGKSTVLPLELLNEPWLEKKKIILLEPRRLAAKATASRMASLLHEPVGETVGYKVRFENRCGKNTRIEVLTEGILTRMLQQEGGIDDAGLIIFDEFHERSLHADLALALCREVQQVLREDLRILVMSATLDSDNLSSLLGSAPTLKSQGRQYPVDIRYVNPDTNTPLQTEMSRAIGRALDKDPGDILAFLPGAAEIHRVAEILENQYPALQVHPLYGDLPLQQQQEAILPNAYDRRKVVLATAIAETSLTIEGITIVIDSGYSRVPRFDPRSGLTRLETVKVTRDAADQRAGRAGRLGPGICYRLWSAGAQHHLIDHRKPEILEADLAPLMLEIAQWGTKDIYSMAWLTPPPSASIGQAKELLRMLGAMKGDSITPKGKEMLRLPTHPRIAHLLLEGKELNLLPLATDIASLLEERDPLAREAGADLSLRVEALRKWRKKEFVNADRSRLQRIEQLAATWRKLFSAHADDTLPQHDQCGKLIAMAYPERVAKQHGPETRYRLRNGRFVRLNDQDALSAEPWLSIAHLDSGTSEGKIYLAAPLNPEDILDLTEEADVLSWDSQKGELIARRELRLGDILVSSTPLKQVSEEARIEILLGAVRSEGLKVLNWTEKTIELRSRIASLHKWRPDEAWPRLDEQHLLDTLEDWLAPFLSTVKKREDFQKINLEDAFQALIPWDMKQKIDRLAPEQILVPSGSQIRLSYSPDGSSPVLAVRLQEMFGLQDTPTVNDGRNKVMLHLLSPGYKPVQVTQDLKSFWKNTYPEVRSELRVRYQKHHWPEDPWTAEAVRGAKRRVK